MTSLARVCLGSVTALAILSGCRARLEPTSALQGGKTVETLLDSQSPTAVLLYSPTNCMACSAEIADWQAVSRSKAIKVVLLLDHEPTPAEAKILRIERVKYDGIYRKPWYKRPPLVPEEMFVEDGQVKAFWDGQSNPMKSAPLVMAAERVRSSVDSTFAPYLKE